MKFHVYVGGDPSVGLQPIDAIVSFGDNLMWDADMIEEIRQMLADFYDTSIRSINTWEEYATILQAERDKENQINL